MTARSREILIQRAKTDLLRRMEDHARIVSRERQIVSIALRAQSGRLRQILEGREKRIGRIRTNKLVDSGKHFRRDPDGNKIPIKINPGKVRIELTKDATVSLEEAKELFKPMIRTFRKFEKSNPDLVYWQIIRLSNGIVATYPYYETDNPDRTHANWMNGATSMPLTDLDSPPKDSRNIPPHKWYDAALNSARNLFWIQPYQDPVTGQIVVAAVSKIQEFRGKHNGAMMTMVPLGSVLKGDLDLTGISRDITSLLVLPRPEKTGDIGLRIIAEENKGENSYRDQGGWREEAGQQWLQNDNSSVMKKITDDVQNEKSGTARMDYKGKDCLWVYAPIKLSRSALILVVPMENIIGTTVESEKFVKGKINNQFRTISAIIWVITAIVLILSLILSKTMTKRISDLAAAFRKLADGDFSTRVEVRGRDELCELSRDFNTLAPALEEQVRLKEALTVAQEVQRSLLPEKPPQIEGLDVAGMSLYCDDTGGDYFDYPHLGIEADELGLAVGDVSGHGVPAALLMTTARAFLRQRAQHGGSLGAVVGDANNLLAEDVRLSGRFMTLFLFAIDLKTHTARWVRAGHDPALVYLPSEDKFSELAGDTGLPLGVDGDWEYIEEHTNLESGSIILIGTDGIWEAMNAQGEMFGKERLNTILRSNKDKTSQEILDFILQSLKDFTAETGFEDDVTLAIVKVVEE